MEENFAKIVLIKHKPMGISKWRLPELSLNRT